jgi:hypothetical protein
MSHAHCPWVGGGWRLRGGGEGLKKKGERKLQLPALSFGKEEEQEEGADV